MRILYGVTGEGMGHATRSRVILEGLLAAGHKVRVVVSGRAHDFLQKIFFEREGITIQEISGLHLKYEGNALDLAESVMSNLKAAPHGVLWNIAAYSKVAEDGFDPEVVISDFETWAYWYGLNHRIPVISIDNMQVINRCHHTDDVTGGKSRDFLVAKMAVRIKIPGAYHYLVTSFFFPPVRKRRTTLVPPILRPEVLRAVREPGDHVLVYQTAASNEALVPLLQTLDYKFRVYGLGKEGQEGNVKLCPFSQDGFVEDLRTARAVIAGGGFSLMGEAVHLHVPMLSVPIDGQYEQELNARYLDKLGYGAWARELDADTLVGFLDNIDTHTQALDDYKPLDNGPVHDCLAELLHGVYLGEPRPDTLESESLGSYGGPLLPEEKG
jgi:uncharacterized protein (TIGR00661 family)